MAFYVKLGPRGILFRAGTIVIGVMGSWVYWRATRRRGKLALRKRTPQLLGGGRVGLANTPVVNIGESGRREFSSRLSAS